MFDNIHQENHRANAGQGQQDGRSQPVLKKATMKDASVISPK
jgi:hypothetical protein